jgi:hypothetical protein
LCGSASVSLNLWCTRWSLTQSKMVFCNTWSNKMGLRAEPWRGRCEDSGLPCRLRGRGRPLGFLAATSPCRMCVSSICAPLQSPLCLQHTRTSHLQHRLQFDTLALSCTGNLKAV